jgi:hypothetical protein
MKPSALLLGAFGVLVLLTPATWSIPVPPTTQESPRSVQADVIVYGGTGDLLGGSEGYAEGDWQARAQIESRHKHYFLSLLYYLQNDPELPQAFRDDAMNWGLPLDEFTDNGHFPFQLYVREARRMLGRYVLRENDLTQDRYKPDGICEGSYGVDCHAVQRLLSDGKWVVEHTRHVALNPYDIPYACLTPVEPDNLLVPVCLSSSHVAYCSVRMEPVYMMLGQAAGDAAHLAIASKATIQKVDVNALRELLTHEGAILDGAYEPPVKIAWTPEHPKAGEAVQFHVESGELKDPLVQTWWDFTGDGKVAVQGEKAEHRFDLEKTYAVSLLVEDKAGRRRMVSSQISVGDATIADVTVDDFDADLFGRWEGEHPSIVLGNNRRTPDIFTGPGIHRDVVMKGKKIAARAKFVPNLPRAGRYEICLGFRPAKDQATNVPIVIHTAEGVKRVTLNERTSDTPFPFVPLGEFKFAAGEHSYLELTNHETDGHIAIDGVRWVWLGE